MLVCTFFNKPYISVWAVTNVLCTASLWCLRVFTVRWQKKIVGVYITLSMKYMFTVMNYNNKFSGSIWSYLSNCLRPYSLWSVVLAFRSLWWDHLRLIRLTDSESDASLYGSVYEAMKGDFTLVHSELSCLAAQFFQDIYCSLTGFMVQYLGC